MRKPTDTPNPLTRLHPAARNFAGILILIAGLVALAAPPCVVAAEGEGSEEVGLDFALDNPSGKSIALSDLLAEGPVLVNFWATWCKPCLKELPYLEEIQREYRERGLTVVAISEDSARSVGKVKSFIKSSGYTFTVLLDTNGLAKRKLKAWATPYTVLFDSDGSKVYAHVGYRPGDEKALAKEVKALMDQRAPEAIEG